MARITTEHLFFKKVLDETARRARQYSPTWLPPCQSGTWTKSDFRYGGTCTASFLATASIGSTCSTENGKTVKYFGVNNGVKVLAMDTDYGYSGGQDIDGACSAYGIGFRPPSRNEIFLLYAAKASIGGFVNDYYWTSTRGSGGDQLYAVDFSSGAQALLGTGSAPRPLRCVRSL